MLSFRITRQGWQFIVGNTISLIINIVKAIQWINARKFLYLTQERQIFKRCQNISLQTSYRICNCPIWILSSYEVNLYWIFLSLLNIWTISFGSIAARCRNKNAVISNIPSKWSKLESNLMFRAKFTVWHNATLVPVCNRFGIKNHKCKYNYNYENVFININALKNCGNY